MLWPCASSPAALLRLTTTSSSVSPYKGLVGSSASPSAAACGHLALAPRQAVELAGLIFKRAHVVAGRIDFQQLQAGRMAFRVDAQSFLEDIFRLTIAAVSDIHVRFGDGVRFIRIEHAGHRGGGHAGSGRARTEQVIARFRLLVFRRQAGRRRHRRFRLDHGGDIALGWRRRLLRRRATTRAATAASSAAMPMPMAPK